MLDCRCEPPYVFLFWRQVLALKPIIASNSCFSCPRVSVLDYKYAQTCLAQHFLFFQHLLRKRIILTWPIFTLYFEKNFAITLYVWEYEKLVFGFYKPLLMMQHEIYLLKAIVRDKALYFSRHYPFSYCVNIGWGLCMSLQ